MEDHKADYDGIPDHTFVPVAGPAPTAPEPQHLCQRPGWTARPYCHHDDCPNIPTPDPPATTKEARDV